MRSVSVSTLKARLAEFLRAVKAGESFVVTERGRATAMLVPAAGGSVDDDLQDLVDAGLIRRGTGVIPAAIFEPSPVKDPEGRTLEFLLEERRSGR
jgi:prevent-host-death family protein